MCPQSFRHYWRRGLLGPTSPNFQLLVGRWPKGRYHSNSGVECQPLRKSYSDSAQCSLRGAAADTVCNMGPNVPLDMIIKKFAIVYGNVKSFDLLMRDFYWSDQGEEQTIPSFATRIEGILSQIRDRFPDQLPQQEEQRLLNDHLFHGSRKSIWDSVKYCFADASLDYMHFLVECRKSEEEGRPIRPRQHLKLRQQQP